MATCVVETPPDIEDVTLTMTSKEAIALYKLLGRTVVGGTPEHDVWKALYHAGFTT